MGNIAIAYLDKYGKGYDFYTPFITVFALDVTRNLVEKELHVLEKDGYNHMMIFRYEREFAKNPEKMDDYLVNWKFVRDHEIKFEEIPEKKEKEKIKKDVCKGKECRTSLE